MRSHRFICVGSLVAHVEGVDKVTFYHRTMAKSLNSAAAAGWDLQRMEERRLSPEQVKRVPDLEGQEHIPRVLGARWKRR